MQAELAALGGMSKDDDESDADADLDPDYAGEEEEAEAEEDDYVEAYDPSMSPPPVDVSRLGDDARLPTVRQADFLRALYAARRKISEETYAPRAPGAAAGASAGGAGADEQEERVDNDLAAERHWRAKIAAEAQYGSDDEEDMDGDEGDLAAGLPSAYDWGDKYRPRKPRYYNRVHTGYEWTQYNQSHYE